MGLSQRVHPELIAKIQEYVSIGTVEPVEVQRLLKHHVNHYMCVENKAYYPSLDDVKNHIAKAKRALDQENAAKLIQKQNDLSPDSKYFFRPYKCKDRENTSNSEPPMSKPCYGSTKSLGNKN